MEALIKSAMEGDARAFGMLVGQTQAAVMRVAFRVLGSQADAEEATQEAFLRAWKQLSRFRFQSSFQTWVCQIAVNVSIDLLRKRKRERVAQPTQVDAAMESWISQFPSGAPGPEKQLEMTQQLTLLQEVLASMKPHHRLVFSLREIDGLSYEEIAESIGVAPGTVESRLHRARKEFQQKMKRLA